MPKFLPTVILLSFYIFLGCLWWGHEVVSIGKRVGVSQTDVSLGDWGDAFSPVNTLFSGLAFMGVAATVYLQAGANKRIQLEAGKAEFERAFFQIFSLVRELRAELRFTAPAASKGLGQTSSYLQTVGTSSEKKSREKQGAEAIKGAFRVMTYRLDKASYSSPLGNFDRERLVQIYNVTVNRHHQAEFGPYFRAIYTLLKRIDQCTHLDEAEKLDYSRLLRSQMTSYETALLGLNGLSPDSRDLSKYIEKYRMLKYSPEGSIKAALRENYEPISFEGRN